MDRYSFVVGDLHPLRFAGFAGAHRGRDSRRREPPAQIPAGATNAPGSHLGYNAEASIACTYTASNGDTRNPAQCPARAGSLVFPLALLLRSTHSARSSLRYVRALQRYYEEV